MSKKILSGMMLTTLLLGMLLVMFDLQSAYAEPEAILYVEPERVVTFVALDFAVNIRVADVVDLFGFEFYLGYNTAILDVLDVIIQPPFDQGPIPLIEIVEPEGYVHVASMLSSEDPPVHGSFSLVSIAFKAVSTGNCTLDLYSTSLVDSVLNPIAHISMDGNVSVLIVGDVDGDGKVEIKDLVLLIKAYSSYPGHPRWNPNADFNGDDKVDIKDLVLIIRHFGEHYP